MAFKIWNVLANCEKCRKNINYGVYSEELNLPFLENIFNKRNK